MMYYFMGDENIVKQDENSSLGKWGVDFRFRIKISSNIPVNIRVWALFNIFV